MSERGDPHLDAVSVSVPDAASDPFSEALSDSNSDVSAAHVALLAGLRGMGPARLRLLLRHHDPVDAVAVIGGRAAPHPSVGRLLDGELGARWRVELASSDVEATWARCCDHGVRVIPYGHHDYPEVLSVDPAPPAVLFVRGDMAVLRRRRAAVIGTRNASRAGLATATALGDGLARAGVAVVSGLARGIDGAVHRGVVDAGGAPIAVVGNGPDRAYPRQHQRLWDEVIEQGVLLSEWPPGTGPDAFRFPMRNRIIAALAEVLVVVESRERGGSLLTVDDATERSVTVMAVPGSPRSRASAGTNQLLCDGAVPVTCTDDVLVALGLDTRRCTDPAVDTRRVPAGLEGRVLVACQESPRTLDELATALGRPVAEVAMALARLERAGRLVETRGWFEVTEPWAGVPR